MPSRERRLGGLALAALTVLLFPRALLLGEAFYERDLLFDWITQVEGFVRSVAQGSWPLWDNAKAFGQPLLANPDAQILYPPHWLNLLVGPLTQYTLFAASHLLLAGTGAAALARRFGASRLAALAAGALFMASGPILSLVNVWHHYASATWIPWVALGAYVTMETPRLRHALAWALAMTGQVYAGSADLCLLGQILVVPLVLRRLSWREPLSDGNRRRAGLWALASLLALGLTAAQWMPTIEQARRSQRFAMSDAMRTAWAVPPLRLLQAALPPAPPDATLDPSRPLAGALSSEGFLRSLYLGLPALALAAAALLGRARGPRVAVAAATAAAALFALGQATPFHGLLTALVPPLRLFRYPSKAMAVVALGIALLAGLGVDVWAEALSDKRRRAGLAAFLGAGVVLALIAAGGQPTAAILAGVAAGALGLALALAGRGSLAVAAAGVGALAIAGQTVNDTAPRAWLNVKPPILDAIGDAIGDAIAPPSTHALGGPRLYVFEYLYDPQRSRRYLNRDEPYLIQKPPAMTLHQAQVLAQRLYPFPPVAGRWGFESSFDPDFQGLYPSYLAQLSRLAVEAETTPLHAWLLRLGAVGHVVALHAQGLSTLEEVAARPTLFPEPARAFRVPRPLPRAYLVSGARAGGDADALKSAASTLEVEREVLLADLSAPVPPDPAFRGAVRRFEVRPDRVAAEVEASGPGWLVMVDAYDPGWRARVDGSPAPLLRANVAFRAVPVPAGTHQVDLVYRPRGVTAGLLVAGLSAAVLLGLAWIALRREAEVAG